MKNIFFILNHQKQKGQALIQALVLTGVIGGLVAFTMHQVSQSQQYSRSPRIKSEMSKLENKFRSDVTYQANYTCPNVPNYTTCQLNNIYTGNAYRRSIRGCVPSATDPFCGVKIEPIAPLSSYDAASNSIVVRGEISYTGTETAIARKVVEVRVPTQVLNTIPFVAACPSNRPLFKSFDLSGMPICDMLPADCPTGSFLEKIQPGQSGPAYYQCTRYDNVIDCAGQILTSFTWNGGNSYTRTCAPIANIFAYFSVPTPSTNGPAGSCDGFCLGGTNHPVSSPTTLPPVTSSTTTTFVAATTTTTAMCIADGGGSSANVVGSHSDPTPCNSIWGNAGHVVPDSSCCSGRSQCDNGVYADMACACLCTSLPLGDATDRARKSIYLPVAAQVLNLRSCSL